MHLLDASLLLSICTLTISPMLTIAGPSPICLQFLAEFYRGTLCPLSSVLFNFSVDLLLFMIAQVICAPKGGLVQACADDIAAALCRLDAMLIMFRVFSIYPQVSGSSDQANAISVLTVFVAPMETS